MNLVASNGEEGERIGNTHPTVAGRWSNLSPLIKRSRALRGNLHLTQGRQAGLITHSNRPCLVSLYLDPEMDPEMLSRQKPTVTRLRFYQEMLRNFMQTSTNNSTVQVISIQTNERNGSLTCTCIVISIIASTSTLQENIIRGSKHKFQKCTINLLWMNAFFLLNRLMSSHDYLWLWTLSKLWPFWNFTFFKKTFLHTVLL